MNKIVYNYEINFYDKTDRMYHDTALLHLSFIDVEQRCILAINVKIRIIRKLKRNNDIINIASLNIHHWINKGQVTIPLQS